MPDEIKTNPPADGIEQPTPDTPAEPTLPGGETPAPDIPAEEPPTPETTAEDVAAPAHNGAERLDPSSFDLDGKQSPADKQDKARWALEQEVTAALAESYTVFITVFSEVTNSLFTERIDEWREDYPGIFWELILPRLEQAHEFERKKNTLLYKCNGLKVLCPMCDGEYPLSVTRYMIENAGRVIAVRSDTNDHDTIYAMDYALTMGRDLRVITIH